MISYAIKKRTQFFHYISFSTQPLLLLKFSDRRRSLFPNFPGQFSSRDSFCVLTKSEQRSVSIPFTFPLYDEMCEQCSGTSARTKCESQGRHLSSIRAAERASSASLGLKQNTRKREVKKLTPTCTADACSVSLTKKRPTSPTHTIL
jgi:hypothetical protein